VRKRLVLIWTPVVLGLALLQPATTLAGQPATYVILKNSCTNTGAGQGHGKSVIQVQQNEYAMSGVRQFRQRAWAQMKWSGSWHIVDSFNWQYSSKFSNNAADHSFTFKFIEHWSSDHLNYRARLKWRGEWLNGNGAVLFYKNVFSSSC
jgi:hypothetical protein